MALSKDIEFRGIQISNCYIKVSVITISDSKDSMSFVLLYQSNADNEAFNSESLNCTYDIYGDNPAAQAYAHLKTLEYFSGAEDV